MLAAQQGETHGGGEVDVMMMDVWCGGSDMRW